MSEGNSERQGIKKRARKLTSPMFEALPTPNVAFPDMTQANLV
jgi:hypothetical protein